MFTDTVYISRKIALGDVLWTEPVIRQLSQKHKHVVVRTEVMELFKNYPLKNVQFVRSFPLLNKIFYKIHRFFKWRFKYIVLDKAYEKNPNIHVLHAYQQAANLPATIEYPKLYLSDNDSNVELPTSEYAVLHLETTSMRNFRNVYGVDWKTVVQFIKGKGVEVIQIGIDPKLIDGARFIKSNLHGMMKLVDHCKMFIGIDSGPSHIAAALHKPCIIFFGAVNPAYRHFKSLLNGIIMQSACEYQHCYHTTISTNGPSCRLVGDEGEPVCSVHSTLDVIANISKFL